MLNLLSKGVLLVLDGCLLVDEGLDLLISFLHLVLLDLDLSLESDDDVVVTDLVHQIVSEALDFVLQFHILFLLLLDVVLELLDGRISEESILEALGAQESVWCWRIRSSVEFEAGSVHDLSDSSYWNWLLSILGLGDQIERNDTLSDHFCLHQDVFVVGRVVVLNLLSDLVEVLVSRISLVGPLELVDPLDVLALELVSVDLESLECLDVNWSVEVELLILLGSDEFLLFLVLIVLLLLVKDLLQFLYKQIVHRLRTMLIEWAEIKFKRVRIRHNLKDGSVLTPSALAL